MPSISTDVFFSLSAISPGIICRSSTTGGLSAGKAISYSVAACMPWGVTLGRTLTGTGAQIPACEFADDCIAVAVHHLKSKLTVVIKRHGRNNPRTQGADGVRKRLRQL